MTKFKVIKKLGEGGQGSVLLVQLDEECDGRLDSHDRKLSGGGFYALKRISCPTLDHLNSSLLEVQSVLRIKHEHVVHCHRFFVERCPKTQEDRLCILYEYCEKGNLMSEIVRARKKGIPIEKQIVLKWMFQISRAVAHLHSHSIVHRDLKPHNLFLTNITKDIKIGDFGFAKLLSESDFANTVLGSQYYLAPEVRSQIPYNHKIDCWGIGAVMLDILLPKTCDFSYEFAVNPSHLLQQIGDRYDSDMVHLVKQIVIEDHELRLDSQAIVEILEEAYLQSLQQDTSSQSTSHALTSSFQTMNPNFSISTDILTTTSSELQVFKEEMKQLTMRCMDLEQQLEERDVDNYFLNELLKEKEQQQLNQYESDTTDSPKSNSFKLFSMFAANKVNGNNNGLISSKEITNVQKADIFGAFFSLARATWKSKDMNMEISVVLKSPHKAVNTSSTLNEFKKIIKYDQLTLFRHPNIERVYGITEIDREYHVVAECLEGGNLQQLLLNHNKQLSFDYKIRIALDVALSLMQLHQQDYIYPMLKGTLICLNGRGEAKLTSLQFATRKSDVKRAHYRGMTPGTQPPEIINGLEVFDPCAVDVYAFSCVMWEIMNRRLVFSEVEVLKLSDIAFRDLRPETSSNYKTTKERDYVELMKRCWSREPELRPKIRHVVYKLAQLLGKQTVVHK